LQAELQAVRPPFTVRVVEPKNRTTRNADAVEDCTVEDIVDDRRLSVLPIGVVDARVAGVFCAV
jgi:hypothetical protein